MDILKEKTKFLATKLAALQSELVVSKNIFQAASREVESMFQKKYFPETPVAPSEQKKEIQDYSEEEAEKQKQNKKKSQEKENKSREDAPDQPSAGKPASPEVKKMFKKIAHQCHPDKLQDMEQGFEKAKKEELYQKARAALENDDLLMMADIANELGLEVPVVVRLEGTNADVAQKILSRSGVSIIAAIGMKDAAEKVVTAALGK